MPAHGLDRIEVRVVLYGLTERSSRTALHQTLITTCDMRMLGTAKAMLYHRTAEGLTQTNSAEGTGS
jgi:hypothetical protein